GRVDPRRSRQLRARRRPRARQRHRRRRRRRAHGSAPGPTSRARVIELRSDFCAPPTDAMWEAMRSAGEESVGKLELTVAFELGKEAAVFCPTCTAANVAALLALGERGRAAIVEAEAHIHVAEGGGLSQLAGLLAIPVATPDGRLSADEVEAAVVTREAAL